MPETFIKKWLDNTNGLQRRAAVAIALLLLILLATAVIIRPVSGSRGVAAGSSAIPEVLRVALIGTETIHYHTPGTPAHFNLALVKHFSNDRNISLELVAAPTRQAAIDLLANDSVDLALSTDIENQVYPYPGIRSIPLAETSLLLIGMQGPSLAPLSITELQNKTVAVNQGSAVADVVHEFALRWPGIQLIEIASDSTGQLLDKVMATEVQYAVVQSNEFMTLQHFFPDLIGKLELDGTHSLAWLASTQDPLFITELEQYIRDLKSDGQFTEIAESNHGHMWNFNYSEATMFLNRVNTVLPRFEKAFIRASEQTDIDWRLLAAVAHQESHWDPEAVSPTGVRGMMMLTRETAAEMGVENRLDPFQSIEGGAAYLRRMMDLLPDNMTQADRTWAALAAYNVGRGHLLDAQDITRSLGGDPLRWQHLRRYLPLLSDPLWYRTARHGAARGHEPVAYVDNVRRYYDILMWITRQREAGNFS